jgi:hypothetical protein
MEQGVLAPPSIAKDLSPMFIKELSKLPTCIYGEFVDQYLRKSKLLGVAFLLWLLSCHYAYLGKWGMQTALWLTACGFLPMWVFDLFCLSGLVGNCNRDFAVDVMKVLKLIHGWDRDAFSDKSLPCQFLYVRILMLKGDS